MKKLDEYKKNAFEGLLERWGLNTPTNLNYKEQEAFFNEGFNACLELELPKYSEPATYSKKYIEWAQQSGLPPLTNTQHKFAEWLLREDTTKIISQIGDLSCIFESIKQFIKK